MNYAAVDKKTQFFHCNYTFSQVNTKVPEEPLVIDSPGDYYNYDKFGNSSIVAFYNPTTHNGAFSLKQLHNLDRLDAIGHFSNNWDGYGSKKIPSEVIKKSKRLLLFLPYQPVIFPTARDSIQMQFELDDKSYLEFEVFDDRIETLIVPKRVYKDSVSKTIEIEDRNTVEEIIREFYGRTNQ